MFIGFILVAVTLFFAGIGCADNETREERRRREKKKRKEKEGIERQGGEGT